MGNHEGIITIVNAEPTIIDWLQAILIPLLAAGIPLALFYWKFRADTKKRLDDLLFDLEHKLFMPDNVNDRIMIFRDSYPEIRKAAMDYERWIMFNSSEKKRLRRALINFQGIEEPKDSVFTLRGTEHEDMIDTFITNSELSCIAPPSSEYTEYIDRISELRKITGSRKWEARPLPPV